MTEALAAADPAAQVAATVRNLMPGLRRLAVLAGIMMAVVIVIALAGIMFALSSDQLDDRTRWKVALFALLFGGLAVVLAFKWMIRRQEALVMPVLASAVGLSYSKDAGAFVRALPKRLLPARGIRAGEDHVRGMLGSHAIQMAEVNVETGGKNSRTLFKGIVAQFPNRTTMPAFFIALEDKTRPGFFSGGEISTDGLHHLRNVPGGGGRTYGVWTSWSEIDEPPALAAVVEVLTRIEDHVGSGTELYAATSNGEEMHVALRHTRNLFRVGGLFPDENALFSDVRTAMQDLSVPLTLARVLIDAEEAAVTKSVTAS